MSAYEAALALGVTKRTIYRWLDEGRLPWPIAFDPANPPTPRPRGPQRNPMSRRYTHGRHTFRSEGRIG